MESPSNKGAKSMFVAFLIASFASCSQIPAETEHVAAPEPPPAPVEQPARHRVLDRLPLMALAGALTAGPVLLTSALAAVSRTGTLYMGQALFPINPAPSDEKSIQMKNTLNTGLIAMNTVGPVMVLGSVAGAAVAAPLVAAFVLERWAGVHIPALKMLLFGAFPAVMVVALGTAAFLATAATAAAFLAWETRTYANQGTGTVDAEHYRGLLAVNAATGALNHLLLWVPVVTTLTAAGAGGLGAAVAVATQD
jgi:hypothetical protein